jgi:hypothetical protein
MDSDCVIPYYIGGIFSEDAPDIVGTYYVNEVADELFRRKYFKMHDRDNEIRLKRIFEDE